MTTIGRVLYATDLSPASAPAWAEAQLLGRLFAAEILCVHVVAPVVVPDGYLPPRLYEELFEGARRNARAAMEALAGSAPDPGVKIATRVDEGAPARRIVEAAAEEGADVIVMGTHGRSGLGAVVLGSVADRVVREAPCPVVTVRADTAPPRALGRICYATDFSGPARAAWPWVVALAEAAGAEVDLLHVTLQAIVDRELSAELLGRVAASIRDAAEERAARFLETSPLPRDRVHVLLPSGAPAHEIVTWAQSRSADLIVMGTHGWSGLVRWMLGSVAQRVIQIAPCPVLTVGLVGRKKEALRDA